MNLSRNSLERRPPSASRGAAPLRPASPVTRPASRISHLASRAFTLIELLVVISILGILAALTVPALKNLGKSNVAVSAARQMLDDVGRARQLAITHRTTVYMVFVPTNYFNTIFWNNLNLIASPANKANALSTATNLLEKQLSGYTFASYGALGDQPGSHAWQYLAPWQSLPDNSYVAAWKFQPQNTSMQVGAGAQQFTVNGFNTLSGYIPFPVVGAPVNPASVKVPYVAFNYLGQLTDDGVNPAAADEYIPLAQGTVGFGYNGATKVPTVTTVNPSDIAETPSGNSTNSMFTLVHIDALTGRARLEFQKVQ